MSLKSYYQSEFLEAGCDEAGRGCLSGPVFAAAVILPSTFNHPKLNDSKQLSANQREELAPIIKQEAIAWAVYQISETEIDETNILKASIKAMNQAILKLSQSPEYLIIDGNRFNTPLNIPFKCIVKGDSLYKSIAAASILAKTERDLYMKKIHEEYPQYGWNRNMGYGTLEHRKALMEFGQSPYHRKSFHLKNQLSLF
jgi:ribonuclease HII